MSRPACCRMLYLVLTLLVLARSGRAEPVLTQSIALKPGWNAVFLEVQPEPRTPAAVFQGVPVESVWTWHERTSPVEFIQDPAEGLWGKPGWNVYYKTPRDAFLTNLYAIQANRAYLVKLGGTQAATWTVTGRPVPPKIAWTPDSFNLVGLSVDPAAPPSFQSFFAPSSAHAGQPVYRLNATGNWVLLPASETVQRGAAYWVFCRGSSDYTGPVKVTGNRNDAISFGDSLNETTLRLRNLAAQGRSLAIRLSTGSGPVVYRNPDPAEAQRWKDLPTNLSAAAGEEVTLSLAVRRAAFPAVDYATLVEVSDGAGSLVRLPLTASAPTHNSLWSGTVTVDRVGEVNANPAEPTPTGTPFSFRLILHVDRSHQARLLKDVILMWENGTTRASTTNPGYLEEDRPGRYVLLTRADLVSRFSGSTLRDGVPVGRRLSSAALDFEGTTLPLSGSFGSGGSLRGTIVLAKDAASNPYRHRYHPDHAAGYQLTRRIELDFTASDPSGADPPGWGYSVLGGVYRETVAGLHKREISVQGTFRLDLASFIDELDPEPLP